jgi:exodeoxyribonuclease VII small subunit
MQNDGAESAPSFEATYERLRKAVEELELGPLSLDAAIARYEEGMRLAQICDAVLDEAELRIRHVLREGDSEASNN